MIKEDKEEWINLYTIADEAYEYAPWNYIKETEFLAFIDDKEDIWYASILGNNKKFYGIIFINNNNINKYLEIYENNYSAIQAFNYQIGLMVSFVNKKDLKDDELHLLKELGISFNDMAIKFQKFEKGYLPHLLNLEDVKKFSYILNNFMVIFKHLKNKKVLPPKKGEMLARFYSSNDLNYHTANVDFYKPEEKYDIISMDSYDLDFSSCKKKDIDIEFDFINYLPVAIGTNYSSGKYKLNKYYAFADSTNNQLIKIDIVDDNSFENENEYNKAMVNKLIEFIKTNYIPRSIIVRDNYSYNLLKEFKDKANISVKIDKIRVIDVFIDSFMKGKK
ncbi:MAG: hypothetical protein IKP12_03975 [Acholeplasmatales bacterium]|nr:hypothetical protein [Acholeplasmatales bacterium]